jgi:polar amino acid transport system substrate-binding protein
LQPFGWQRLAQVVEQITPDYTFRSITTGDTVMTQLSTRRFLQIAGLGAAALLLAACGKKDSPPAPAAAPVAAAPASAPPAPKVYTVGTDAAYAPFESQNEKGEIVGFDIDVAKAVAAKAGVELKFVNTPWEGIFNALGQGDRDLVVSAVTITAERKQTMDFSDPYFDAQQLIAIKDGSKIAKFADLKKLKVGVQTGTTGDEAVTKLLGKTSTNIKRFESTPLALKELESGGVDAVVADNGVIIHYVANNPGGKFKTVADKEFVPEQYGMALKKGNTELQGLLNKGLAAIKADGTYDRIYIQYFGAPPAAAAAAAPASAASK